VSTATPDPIRILLADDDEGNREVLAYYLRRQGFDVRAVQSGHEALAALDRTRFALLLLDVVMPGIDGLETLKLVRARFTQAELPVILFTGLDDPDAMASARELGANAWLAKPYQLADLHEAVKGQLGSPSTLDR
jgi:DNA-binding response OmpR family regulator